MSSDGRTFWRRLANVRLEHNSNRGIDTVSMGATLDFLHSSCAVEDPSIGKDWI